ncbi:MAG: hypothetical protein NXH82_04315 [Rhodobacteraceae bacterium]|nr:hypothetical protein [Paracoccaceae bacterium]
MLGVVLWTDPDKHSAVIWCDDHGDLAFYGLPSGVSGPVIPLRQGDMLEFDVVVERGLRFARQPSLVSQAVYPNLADQLIAASPCRAASQPRAASAARVIAFPAASRAAQSTKSPGSTH